MDNPLKGILAFFGRGGASAVGIDIGSSAIKVVQLRKQGGRAVLETYGELALGPYNNVDVGTAVRLSGERVAEALTDVLRESKITTHECAVAIPISSSLVTVIGMPLVDEKQLAQMVPIEARKYIPVPISEVSLDWWVIPRETGNVSYPLGERTEQQIQQGHLVDVLLAVIHNDAIMRYQEILKSVGLNLSFYEIEIFSTIRAVLAQETEPVMILDLGAATTKLYVVDRGVVKSSHMVNRGSQDITLSIARGLNMSMKEAELLKRNIGLDTSSGRREVYDVASTTLSYIFSEASRVISNYENKGGQSIKKVILTGGGALLKNFHEFANDFFDTEAVIANPFAKVEAPAFLGNVLEKAGPEFAVAIGLALRKLQEMN